MRLEKQKHIEAEQRLRASILQQRDYLEKSEDLALVRRKRREGREVREVLDRGGG